MNPAVVERPTRSRSFEIRAVDLKDRAMLKRFIEYPYQRYRGHRTWVPPLLVSEWEALNPKKNPFFDHAEVQPFLALENGTDRIQGRITAILDANYNACQSGPAVLFAQFEAESAEVAQALFDTVAQWGHERGMKYMRGPSQVMQNNMMGLLIENFENPPAVMMPYNPPEYQNYFEAAGFKKIEDTLAWRMTVAGGLPERVAKIAQRVKRNLNLEIRTIDFKNLDREAPIIREIYNSAWQNNWGFVPWTEAEIEHMKNELKLVADKATSFIAEASGRPVAFSITLPDINESLRGTGGRLFPLGLPKLLLNKPKRMRLIALGILEEFRGRGIDAVLYAESFWRGSKKYEGGEFGWTLESNPGITEGMKALGAIPYKRYRIFEKVI